MTEEVNILCHYIANNIDDGIIVVDKKMNICYWNKWIADRYHKNIGHVLGKPLGEVFPEIVDSHLHTVIQNTIENGSPQFLSNLFHDAPIKIHPPISAFNSENSPIFKLDINTIPIKVENSIACIIQIRDVSLSSKREDALEKEILKRAVIERELRESESRYRLLAENTSDIIIKVDEKLSINYISPSCLTHLGYADAEFLNSSIFEHTHPDDIELLNVRLKISPNDPHTQTLRHRLRDNHGSYFWFETTAKPYHTETPPASGYVLVTRNIEQRIQEETNRENLKIAMDRNQRMLAIGQLTGGIAHRFNNLLTSIIGYTELCQTLPEPIEANMLSTYLQQVTSSSEIAKELVVQLLEYSQNRSIPLQPLDLVTTVNNTVNLISSIMPSGISIELTNTENMPLTLANKVQIEQILINLCLNAKDAMHDTGTIFIQIEPMHQNKSICSSCHATFSGDYISLSIEDSGDGIEGDDVERIFQPFYTSKGIAEASGLGLSVAHGITHSLGGHILVNSSPKGSQFSILLPPA